MAASTFPPEGEWERRMRHYWGVDNVVRWSASTVEELDASVDTKRFLMEIGLPRSIPYWNLQFVDGENAALRICPARPHLRVIGEGLGYKICIDHRQDDRIVVVDEPNPDAFVNSGVRQLGVFLYLHQRAVDELKSSTGPRWREVVRRTEEAMKAIDPTALRDPDSFWPPLLREMRVV